MTRSTLPTLSAGALTLLALLLPSVASADVTVTFDGETVGERLSRNVNTEYDPDDATFDTDVYEESGIVYFQVNSAEGASFVSVGGDVGLKDTRPADSAGSPVVLYNADGSPVTFVSAEGLNQGSDKYPTWPGSQAVHCQNWSDSQGRYLSDASDWFTATPNGTSPETFTANNLAGLECDRISLSIMSLGSQASVFTSITFAGSSTDGDGVCDATDTVDGDGDGYADDCDDFPNDATEWADSDGDGIGDNADVCEVTVEFDGSFEENGISWSNEYDIDNSYRITTLFGENAWHDRVSGYANALHFYRADQVPLTLISMDGIDYDPDPTVSNLSWQNNVTARCRVDATWRADGVPEAGTLVGNEGLGFFDSATLSTLEPADAVGFEDCDYLFIRQLNASNYDNNVYVASITFETADDGGVTCDSAFADSDGDGVADEDDAFPNDASESVDSDGDGVGDNADAFPNDAGESADSDGDGVGDNADAFPNDAGESADSDGDGVGDNADAFPNDAGETDDTDGDLIGDNTDNCIDVVNFDQADTDGDYAGDECDFCPTDPNDVDDDGDLVCDVVDTCLGSADNDIDSDGDNICDFNDLCEGNDATGDTDSDGYCDASDNCSAISNPGQTDTDGNGIGDDCQDTDGDNVLDIDDNCPSAANADQADSDGDYEGDVCDADDDNDGIDDSSDNCQLLYNPDQADFDGDGQGDVCDGDDDADGVSDTDDLCPGTALSVSYNADGCSGEQFVALEAGSCADYPNHGQYVRAVTHAANQAKAEGLLSGREKAALVRAAAQSSCN